MKYLESDILNRLEQDTTPTNVWRLYKREYVKNIGITSDTKRPFAEIVSEWLLKDDHLKRLDNIQNVIRNQSYDMGHTIDHEQLRKTNNKHSEKFIAKALFAETSLFHDTYDEIGDMRDFQTPLKGSEEDVGVGEIDLFSYNEKTNKVYLLELKREDNKESLLRCVLEIYTYWKQLQHEQFLRNFKIRDNAEIVPAVLVFQDGKQHQQFKSDLTETKNLMKKLGVKFFTLRPSYKVDKGE